VNESLVTASEARQSMTPEFMDCHVADATRNDDSTRSVRLLLDDKGHAQAQAFALPPSPSPVTPLLRCGLLDGIGREMYLKEGRLIEAVVRVDDLPRVQALAFINSLRGGLDARLPR